MPPLAPHYSVGPSHPNRSSQFCLSCRRRPHYSVGPSHPNRSSQFCGMSGAGANSTSNMSCSTIARTKALCLGVIFWNRIPSDSAHIMFSSRGGISRRRMGDSNDCLRISSAWLSGDSALLLVDTDPACLSHAPVSRVTSSAGVGVGMIGRGSTGDCRPEWRVRRV